MFDSIEKYISFFKEVKNNATVLQRGAVPKVVFDWEAVRIVVAIIIFFLFILNFLFFRFPFVTSSIFFKLAFWTSLVMFGVILIQKYLYFENEKTSLKSLLAFNLTSFIHFSGIRKLMDRYPKVSPLLSPPLQQKPRSLEHDFALFLGRSTGVMSRLWHGSALAPKQNVLLSMDDACKNILTLGGIGSGKTSGIMQPLLLQLLHQGCGGLIFDIKGDVKNTSFSLAKSTNRHIRILGPSQSRFNILHGLRPEVASSYLKSSLLLSNQHSSDGFWVDTAAELSRNVLGLLSFIPKHYTLADLYRYIFDKDAYSFIEKQLDSVKKSLEPGQKRLFDTYRKYKTSIFDSFDEKVKSGVKATLAQTISPFNHPDLIDAFCSNEELDIEKILDGEVFLVDMPIATWGLGAKVAYTFIKLRFFNLMQKHHNAENRKLPVFFMCDEFQEIVSCNRDGLSDLNFWDKSRSSKTIGIISAQSIASFFAATPNRDYAYALLQNFRNKICLASEDPLTIDYISQLTGQAKTKKKSRSLGQHSSETISESRDAVLEAQVFRSLSPRSALAFLNINNLSSDDALRLYPIFLKANKTKS